jgi:hypothetical protein
MVRNTSGRGRGRNAWFEGIDACLEVRDKPGLDADAVDCVAEGAEVHLGERIEHADWLEWWQIPGQGWPASDFLRRIQAVLSGDRPAGWVLAEFLS